ncbi:MAG: sulfurtransferase [Verrucomicrobiae bacterium]|nr:sulfurtransferase [Verrucomicrobiae bacterium]
MHPHRSIPICAPLALSISALLLAARAPAQIGLISPQEVHTLIHHADPGSRPLVLDTRGGYKDYIRAHLPTAHHINFDTLRGTDRGVPVQYLPDDLTRHLLVRAGVDRNRTHVLYAEGGTGDEILSASMVAHVLEKFGVRDIRILDGGWPDYRARFATTQDYPDTPRGRLPARMNRGIAVSVHEVMSLKDRPGVVLVDARPALEFRGEDDLWPRQGHIPGAIHFHWARVMTDANTHKFRPPSEMAPELEAAGLTPDKDILVYCGTSREGSLLRFYLKHLAGYPNVRLYEGSWKEYAAMKHLPVATGP